MNKTPTGKTIVLEGNGQRPSHFGNGYKESDVMYTLNTTEVHGVAYAFDRATYNQGQNALWDFSIEPELCPPIIARGPCGVFQPVENPTVRKPVPYQRITGAVDACIGKGTSNQLVGQDMFVVEEFVED